MEKYSYQLGKRTISTLVECPVFFFYAFAWEAFALISEDSLGDNKFSARYCFMTGLGAFIGALTYSVILLLLQYQLEQFDFKVHFSESVLRGIAGGVTTGTLWQFSVNISEIYGFTFTEGFFFVFAMSAVTFMLMICMLRFLHDMLPNDYKLSILPLSMTTFTFDWSLSLATAASDAFFVGTDNDQFTGAWLGAFNVPDAGMSYGTSIALAGASGLVGFLVFQALWNLITPEGWNWVDGIPAEQVSVLREGGDDETANLLHDS
jgi:hypothetical protein